MGPGIYPNITDEAYHGGPGVSKSMLWTLHSKTPAHLKYDERSESAAFDVGKAAHCAILEPHRFEQSFKCGPDDRRGNKWKEAVAEAGSTTLLTAGEYENVVRMRDVVLSDPTISALVRPGAMVEHSAYWTSYEPIELCKCRPDLYRPEIGVMLDLKTTVNASGREFAKSCASYGYHAQAAWYSEGWVEAGGGAVNNFIFLAVEKTPPYAYALYELDALAFDEGRKLMRRALREYVACKLSDRWPGYPQPVQPLSLPKWAFTNEDMPL